MVSVRVEHWRLGCEAVLLRMSHSLRYEDWPFESRLRIAVLGTGESCGREEVSKSDAAPTWPLVGSYIEMWERYGSLMGVKQKKSYAVESQRDLRCSSPDSTLELPIKFWQLFIWIVFRLVSVQRLHLIVRCTSFDLCKAIQSCHLPISSSVRPARLPILAQASTCSALLYLCTLKSKSPSTPHKALPSFH